MDKKSLRKKYKELRATLSEEQQETLSLAIANRCLELPIWDKKVFHLFLPIKKFHEVDTHFLLHILQGRDKDIVLSKSDFETNTMQHFLLTEQTQLICNAWGIPEPVDGFSVSEDQIDVVFVPLLAFDTQGNRVGYGKGFYDAFLSKCKPTTRTVGLSFFEPESKIEDVRTEDFSLDFVVTPEKIYTFKSK